ncbi:L,D-transpeptidase family protein [Shewanella sp. VB17]|uniref:L,D-transpeptidase family protein n=1 Tax=Shewanella sp. VB17 TaxID=2739432 RepID=UPI0015632FAC|nr:L,D-transpeptidase family protein [Shewanella sp. VB17]NRD73852.1 L,D-transpeptidase family protein [Shewanella sp. VB17]
MYQEKLRRIICSVLFTLFYSTPASALDRVDAAINSLYHQIQLVNLINPSEVLMEYQAILAQGTRDEQLKIIDNVQLDLAQFWRSVNIPIQGGILTDDLHQNAMLLEPISQDYLPISNRIRYLLWIHQHQNWKAMVLNVWLEAGDEHPAIPEIRQRLQWLGDLTDVEVNNNLMTSALVEAILRFQHRHGLKQDGIIGPATLRWINLTPKKRATLLANNFINKTSYLAIIGARFLLVNIPAFEMILVDKGEVQLQSRVIVGKPYRQTPRLSSHISNMVLNPSWRVPTRLLRRDLLPKVRQNGSYISEHNFDVYNSVGSQIVKTPEEWQELAGGRFPYRLEQKPGEENTLGRYKFYFENKYNIYLHDTYDKALFEESNRALSSGCIRVEKVESLANWLASNLVKDKQTWVELQTDREKTQWFSFDHSLAVHLVYWTAWMDRKGLAQFRNDIYHQNSMLNLVSMKE